MSRSRRRIAHVSWIRFHCRSVRKEVSYSRTRVVTTRQSRNSAASLKWIRIITRRTGYWATRTLQINSLMKLSQRRRRRLTCLRRTPGALGILGLAYGLADRKAEAKKILDELLKLNETRYVTPAAFVNVYIGLGDKDKAFEWLEKAYQERSNYVAYLKVFPIADPLRSDPRFADLLRRVGLRGEKFDSNPKSLCMNSSPFCSTLENFNVKTER